MKYLLILLLLVYGCYNKGATRIDQEVIKGEDLIILCGARTCFRTIVWYENEIVRSWYDNITILTDSIVLLRQKQGEDLLLALKKSK